MKPRAVRGAPPGEIRLIGGQWKRRKLPVPTRDGLRPTPDRVRETLFNWLGQELTGWRCIDAFAGSGALGFEAASRGAQKVWLVEADAGLVAGLRAVRELLGAGATTEVVQGDGLAFLRRQADASAELVFLDPPYASTLLAPALAEAARVVCPGGFVYAESPQPEPALPAGVEIHRRLHAGQVHAHLLRRA